MTMILSKHAEQRWQERCSGLSAEAELPRAKRINPKRLARLESKAMRKMRASPGTEVLMTPSGIMVVCRQCNETDRLVLTVYRVIERRWK